MTQDSSLTPDDKHNNAVKDIGIVLRDARLKQGKTLDDIGQALRIRKVHLDAIERGDVAEFPARAYAIGFVRSYATYLGVDGDEAVTLFKAQYMAGVRRDAAKKNAAVPDTHLPPVRIIVVCLFLIGGFVGLYQHYILYPPAVYEPIPAVPEEIEQRVMRDMISDRKESSSLSDVMQSLGVSDVVGGATAGITLTVIANSWIEIRNEQGAVIVSAILEANDQYFIPNSPHLTMSLGNAAHVSIAVNGRVLQPLGQEGEVRRDIPLDTAFLNTLAFEDPPAESAP